MTTGREILDRIEAAHGEDGVDAAVGAWIARAHRKRSPLVLAKPQKPARAPHYLAFVRQLNCCFCGAQPPSDPHHHGPRGMGQKTDDYRTIPLCRMCHDKWHSGDRDVIRFSNKVLDTLIKYLRIVEAR